MWMRAVCFFLVQLQGIAHILSSGGQCARHPCLDEHDCELLFWPCLYQSLINKVRSFMLLLLFWVLQYLECFSLLFASYTIGDHRLLVSWYVPDWQPCSCLQLFIGAMYVVSSSLGVFARVLVSSSWVAVNSQKASSFLFRRRPSSARVRFGSSSGLTAN